MNTIRPVRAPFIIAELGINWNGDYDMLEKLGDSAMEHGADFVKLQIRTPEICVPKDQWDVKRMWFDGKTELRYIDYKRRMELSEKQLKEFKKGGRKCWRPWFSSVWDKPSFDRYWWVNAETAIVKIPSAKITDLDLLSYVAGYPCEIIISTGMSTEQEIIDAIVCINNRRIACNQDLDLVVMACNSSYPTADKEVNLLSLLSLRYLAERLDIPFQLGFSSHSPSPFPAIYSTFFNVRYIEVHYTLDRTLQGSDHAASLEASGLELISREAKRIPVLLGNGELKVYDSELSSRAKLRG